MSVNISSLHRHRACTFIPGIILHSGAPSTDLSINTIEQPPLSHFHIIGHRQRWMPCILLAEVSLLQLVTVTPYMRTCAVPFSVDDFHPRRLQKGHRHANLCVNKLSVSLFKRTSQPTRVPYVTEARPRHVCATLCLSALNTHGQASERLSDRAEKCRYLCARFTDNS